MRKDRKPHGQGSPIRPATCASAALRRSVRSKWIGSSTRPLRQITESGIDGVLIVVALLAVDCRLARRCCGGCLSLGLPRTDLERPIPRAARLRRRTATERAALRINEHHHLAVAFDTQRRGWSTRAAEQNAYHLAVDFHIERSGDCSGHDFPRVEEHFWMGAPRRSVGRLRTTRRFPRATIRRQALHPRTAPARGRAGQFSLVCAAMSTVSCLSLSGRGASTPSSRPAQPAKSKPANAKPANVAIVLGIVARSP